ncbi:N-acetyltransferase [Flagellimonas allohymeniacidonis]|uniref:N-acetyltransferase n=2 Tax=Flagellimonas allohymeniacidonis TaxID=2517819 RepID=A0A4Q8QH25_9FLAO|nr:N-acetyltransferase [Allomuricauda hymeniacidonis]
MKVSISTDKGKMDIGLIHEYLSKQSYWAKGRSYDLVEKSMANSLCFGAFDENDKQIGFARIATDYVVFAWLMDVFVVDDCKGKGIGKQLLQAILEHPNLTPVNGIGLRTEDAHDFYASFGFEEIPKPNTWMLKTKS